MENTKTIKSVVLEDAYYPCMPPSYTAIITYSDDTVIRAMKSSVELYQKYKDFLSPRSLNRIKDALRQHPWPLDFEVEPNARISGQSRFSMWGYEDITFEDDEDVNREDSLYNQQRK